MNTLRRWNITVGNLFFHYRNALFPVTIGITVVLLRPRILFDDPSLDHLLASCGAAIALLGQGVRLLTIGYDYIERGGRAGQVYASHLVHGGVYALTRNPMYIGNTLIVIGVVMVSGAPAAYWLIAWFLFVYQSIIAAEEAYLRQRFGRDYDEYCALVPRFLPKIERLPQALSRDRYQWRAALRKELSTMAGLFTGLSLLPLWRTYFLDGMAAAQRAAMRHVLLALGILLTYGFLVYLKKHRRFFYLPAELTGATE